MGSGAGGVVATQKPVSPSLESQVCPVSQAAVPVPREQGVRQTRRWQPSPAGQSALVAQLL